MKEFISKPHCLVCTHAAKNDSLFDKKLITGTLCGRKYKKWIKPLEIWCLHSSMFKVNRNHLRWWGFDRNCPLNPYTHTCEVCGLRMCTSDTMCRSCRRNRQYL